MVEAAEARLAKRPEIMSRLAEITATKSEQLSRVELKQILRVEEYRPRS